MPTIAQGIDLACLQPLIYHSLLSHINYYDHKDKSLKCDQRNLFINLKDWKTVCEKQQVSEKDCLYVTPGGQWFHYGLPIVQHHESYEDGTFKYFNYRSKAGEFLLTDGSIINTDGDIMTLDNQGTIWGRNTLTCKDEIVKYLTTDYESETPLDVPMDEIFLHTEFLNTYGGIQTQSGIVAIHFMTYLDKLIQFIRELAEAKPDDFTIFLDNPQFQEFQNLRNILTPLYCMAYKHTDIMKHDKIKDKTFWCQLYFYIIHLETLVMSVRNLAEYHRRIGHSIPPKGIWYLLKASMSRDLYVINKLQLEIPKPYVSPLDTPYNWARKV